MRDPDLPALKARAEQMRRAGVLVHDIASAVGRTPSTIYEWAAQGNWRVEDLESEIGGLDAEHPEGVTLRNGSRVHASGAPRDDGNDTAAANTPEPLTPLEAAKQLHQRSADLAAAGQIRPAEAAARLADRILRTEYHLTRIDGPPGPETPAEEPEMVKAELADRFRRISRHYHRLKADGDPEPEKCLPKAVYFMAELHKCSVEEFLTHPEIAPEM